LKPRPHNSHKGSYGDVLVVGGSAGMQGAVILAARAALHAGAGRVYAGFFGTAPSFDPMQPELMCRDAGALDFASGVVLAGPGLGVSQEARLLLEKIVALAPVLVLDADALNLAAADVGLREKIASRTGATLITPHPAEAARLLGSDTAAVQADRLKAAATLAKNLHAICVLKASGSIIAAPDGQAVINPTGNPALASAGSGDVLGGLCAALLAQGVPAWEAALAAVWLHGAAADALVEQGVGPIGLCAGELITAIRVQINRLAMQASCQT
jgi:ADP-dependent NAD(P)H-hydrate dehydratase / NAD(P)H-hydrate epimerase